LQQLNRWLACARSRYWGWYAKAQCAHGNWAGTSWRAYEPSWGGEVIEYTRLLAGAREEAVRRMEESAEELGANAIVSMRLMTSMVIGGAAEILAYDTAVLVEES
jgi:uncharacterized protein YbjQ (UPF0145 family)